ncbi:hypothetical protein [Sphingobium phenoxybenzoativorans]|uniref:hypothetical protein n=1 Tax=Sphingobium phenoxybenzoativorans TaxID=1592790 RepID=UPI000872252D|nr:hypothetical protein [Sphingobium phenoxybenzoativorans]
MTELEMEQGGTMVATIWLPSPWPVPASRRIVGMAGQDCVFIITAQSDGSLNVATVDLTTEALFVEAWTPEIKITGVGLGVIVLTAIFNKMARSLLLRINGSPVTSDDDCILLNARSYPGEPLGPLTEDVDGLKRALRKRQDRLRNYKREGLDLRHKARRWSDLETECRLLHEETARLRDGNLDYVRPVSLNLRKIIGDGQGNHLLQDCASFLSLPIGVWRRPIILTGESAIPIVTAISAIHGAAEPVLNLTEKTDLDIWLDDECDILFGKKWTNLELIREISDRVGAHSDMFNRAVAEELESHFAFDRTLLATYLISLADLVLALMARVQSARGRGDAG